MAAIQATPSGGKKSELDEIEDRIVDEMEEYMVAADLTLYANPLNMALLEGINVTQSSSPKQDRKMANHTAPDKKEEEEEEVIASDMTRYDSPMASLDIAALNKEKMEDNIANRHMQDLNDRHSHKDSQLLRDHCYDMQSRSHTQLQSDNSEKEQSSSTDTAKPAAVPI